MSELKEILLPVHSLLTENWNLSDGQPFEGIPVEFDYTKCLVRCLYVIARAIVDIDQEEPLYKEEK